MKGFTLNRIRLFLAIGFSSIFFGCAKTSDLNGLPNPSDQSSVVTSEYPAVVKVILPGGSGLCTGTFISPRAVLTAAHCTNEDGRYTIISSFGSFTTYTVVNHGPGTLNDPTDISILVLDEDVADVAQGQVIPLGENITSGNTVRIIGFGCNDIETRRNAGVKRTGTNQVFRVRDHIEIITPLNSNTAARGITGSINRSGACFGDSGGPMLVENDGVLNLVGTSHSGSWDSEELHSFYSDITHSRNRDFIATVNSNYSLGIEGF